MSTTRSNLKNCSYEVTEKKLLNTDTCQQFKAHQEQDGGESYIFFFFTIERIMINAKMHRREMLQTRIPALESLYKVKFKIKGVVQKNDASNTIVKNIM